MAYYPPPGSHVQPVVYTGSHHSHHPSQLGYAAPYPQQLQYVPSHHSGHVYAAPQVMAPQVIMQPGYTGSGHHGHHGNHYYLSFGERLRRFFGLAPRGPFKYRHNRGTWGFMGFSRKPRYTDAYTGMEVDRKGRPIYRV